MLLLPAARALALAFDHPVGEVGDGEDRSQLEPQLRGRAPQVRAGRRR
jgi:hypothetical protein